MYFVCLERSFYWTLWLFITVFALYEFSKVCQIESYLGRLDIPDLHYGTLSVNRYDASDFSWQSFKKLYINYWYIFLIHFTLSNVFTVYHKPVFKLSAWILITLYATYTVFSASALIVVIINVLMLILLAILGKNILSYALCFGVILASQSTEIANRIFNSNDPRMTDKFDFEEKRFLFTYCICFLNARGLSSSLDNLTAKQKKEIQSGKEQFYEKVITITAYLLYLPGFFAGPIYLYNDFEKATRLVNKEPEKEIFLGRNYFKAMTSLFVLLANIIYYEWVLHWIYSSAISADHTLIGRYSSWQFSGLIVSLCLLFYLKYSSIYGTFKVLATFDGVASISPPLPQCPGAMHLTSQLWRYFDVGIYVWLRKYIYDPAMRPRKSLTRRFTATLLCYLCVTLWHLPLRPTLVMWISLNIINTFIEVWARTFAKTDIWSGVKDKLSRPFYLRLLAIIGIPVYALAVISNVFFLSDNEEIGYELVKRILNNTNNYGLYFLSALYFGANVSLDYNRVVKRSVDFATCHGFPSSRKEANTKSDPKKNS